MTTKNSTMSAIFPNYEVVVKEEAPFVIVDKDSEGKLLFSGISIDFLKKVAEKAQFSYNIKLTNHEDYGYQKESDNWNGLLSEISNKNADLAVGPIPVPLRQDISDIEFSKPYMSSGINLLIKYPPDTVRGIGLMLEPFATEVWVMICLAFIVVSLALFLIGRFSPYEWAKVVKEKDVRLVRTSFGLKNSFLFTASTLGWQGYKEAPRSLSGRILMCIWFMFTVFVIVAYTACLSAILTSRSESVPQQLPFADYEDIVDNKDVKIGAMKYHHVYQVLKHGKVSHNNIFSKLFMYIDDSQEWIKHNKEGVQRVKDSGGKYVLLMETVKADYVAATNCDVIPYGETLSTFGYSFAGQKKSPLMERVTLAILDLNEDMYIQELIAKYIHKKQVCPAYDKTKLVPQKRSGSPTHNRVTSSMDMRDMAIPFLFLFLGVLCAGGALGAEHYYKHRLANKNADNKGKKLLNTDSSICKAPKVSPPPPPIYKAKVNNKLQESNQEKSLNYGETVKLGSDQECEEENDGNQFEMIALEDKIESDKPDEIQVQIEEVPSQKEIKVETLNEMA
nr:glutamate receptor 2-like [Biomphalaria glabrata]